MGTRKMAQHVETQVYVDGLSLRPIGSRARLGGDLGVRVIAIQVQCGPRIIYEIVWTLDSQRHVEWVEECELE